MLTSPGGPKRVALLTAAQTGASQWIDVTGYQNLTVVFKTNGNPGAGTCLIEEGDWNSETQVPPGVTFSAVVTVDIDASVGTDGQYFYHLPAGRAYHYIRTRIGTSVTVATLDTVLLAN